MADLIKKIKIKKQDGTFTDYIPIGAEAKNISTNDSDSVELKLSKKPYYYNNVADMKADTKLKIGNMVITLGYYEENDGGHGEYIIVDDDSLVDDGGSIHVLTNGLKAKLIIDDSIVPEVFGAYGDETHDDSTFIQSAINYATNNKYILELNKKYLITSSIEISGQYFNLHGENSIITYTGNDSAIKITGLMDSILKFGKISAENGNGIEIYTKNTSSWQTSGWSQYNDIYFKVIRALDKCIYFNRSSNNEGWISEIRVHNGKLEHGNYGIYADAKNLNVMNNISFYNIGIEGVTTGIYLANKCFYWNFKDFRYAESFTTLIETVGDIRSCVFDGSIIFPVSQCTISEQTSNFIINGPIGNGGYVIAYNGSFYEGAFRPQIKNLECLNLNRAVHDTTVNYVMPKETLTDYITIGSTHNTSLQTIKLNKSFPTSQWGDLKFAINEFILAMNFTTPQSLIIYDANDNIVFNQGQNYTKAYLKFKFITNVGWICEEMNVVPTV